MSLDEFTFQLLHADSYDESFRIFNNHVESLGFEGSLYVYVPKIILDQDLSTTPMLSTSDSYNPAFIKHYLEADYVQIDGVFSSVMQGQSKPIDWWEYSESKLADVGTQKVLDVARHDYSLQNGITIPASSNGSGVGAVSIITNEKGETYERLKEESLQSVVDSTEIFHMMVMHKGYNFDTFIRPILESFSRLEKDAIRHIPTSSTIKELADKIGSTSRYTDKVLRNIRLKIGGEDVVGRPKINVNTLRYYIMLMDLHQKL